MMLDRSQWLVTLLLLLAAATRTLQLRMPDYQPDFAELGEISEAEIPYAPTPPTPECNCLRWTNWISADTAGDSGDWETLGPPDDQGRPGTIHHVRPDICTIPVRMECRTVADKLPWYLTQERITFQCNPMSKGFACENKKQEAAAPDAYDSYHTYDGNAYQTDGKCHDYETRVLCFYTEEGYNECPCLYWTKWYNNDNPTTGRGDEEIIGYALPKYVCEGGFQPVDVQCKTVAGLDVFHAGNKKIQCNLHGLSCLNEDQGKNCKCHDYEVRFLCPRFAENYPITVYNEKEYQTNYGKKSKGGETLLKEYERSGEGGGRGSKVYETSSSRYKSEKYVSKPKYDQATTSYDSAGAKYGGEAVEAYKKPGYRPEYPDTGYNEAEYTGPGYKEPSYEYPGPGYKEPEYPEPDYKKPEYPGPGYKRPEYPQRGYKEPEYPGPGYKEPEYPRPNYKEPEYPRPGYKRPEYPDPSYKKPGYGPEYPEPGYKKPEYPEPGYKESSYEPEYPEPSYKKSEYPPGPEYPAAPEYPGAPPSPDYPRSEYPASGPDQYKPQGYPRKPDYGAPRYPSEPDYGAPPPPYAGKPGYTPEYSGGYDESGATDYKPGYKRDSYYGYEEGYGSDNYEQPPLYNTQDERMPPYYGGPLDLDYSDSNTYEGGYSSRHHYGEEESSYDNRNLYEHDVASRMQATNNYTQPTAISDNSDIPAESDTGKTSPTEEPYGPKDKYDEDSGYNGNY